MQLDTIKMDRNEARRAFLEYHDVYLLGEH